MSTDLNLSTVLNLSTKHMLDSDLHPVIDFFPEGFMFTDDNLPDFRASQEELLVMGDPDSAGVTREEIQAPGVNGPDVRCLLYKPAGDEAGRPGYLHIHGGGYIIGTAEGSDIQNIAIAAKLGAVVVSVDYRLAPETPIPGPLEDCYAGLAWLHAHAEELNVDPARIAIGGESAGGGLAASLAILARDRGEYPICHQHLTYPMLDNQTGAPGHEGDPLVGEFVWTRAFNQYGWKSYLGNAEPVAPQVPARLEDFSDLPSTWLFTAALDLFRDENIAYAQKLLAAGVPTDFLLYPSACHGFQMVPGAKSAERFVEDHRAALARGLSVDI